MHPIDSSKLSAELTKVESDKNSSQNTTSNINIKSMSSTEINSKLNSVLVEKQHLIIGQLLKQTLQRMTNEGLLSVDTQKAILSAKNILPGEFTQLYIQDRLQQHKLANTLATMPIKPLELTNAMVNQWHSGQLLQSIVYQSPKSGTASLLVNSSGQFSPALLVQLTVLQSNNTQSTNKLINDEIIKQAQVVQIKTSLSIEPGQQLLLQVNKDSSGITFDLKHSPKESNLVSQYINQLITRQQALPQLIASLKEIATQSSPANTFFTPTFKSQVESVLQQFPQLAQLSTGQDIKKAVQNSGLYLESKLVNSNTSTNTTVPISSTDLKAALSRLVTLISNNEAVFMPKQATAQSGLYQHMALEGLIKPSVHSAPFFDLPNQVKHAQVQKPVLELPLLQLNNHLLLQTRLLDQIESVLSRIIISQFQARESSDQSFLNVEIPFRHNDQQEILQLKIREEKKEKEAELGNKIWTVNMAFNLQSLGGIRIYITLDKIDLAIQFWTEEKDSQRLIQNYFTLLSERLISAGFTLSQLVAIHGIPEEAQKEQTKSQFILDEKV